MKKCLYMIVGLCLPQLCAISIGEHINQARALHAYKNGDCAAAQEIYESLVIDHPDDAQLLMGLGNTCYAQQNYAQAVDYYQLSMRQKVGLAKEPALFNVGCAQARLQQLKEALASFEEVVRINAANQRAKKNCEILRKMLQQQKSGKNDDKKSSKEQSKQSDKQNPKSGEHHNGQQDKQQHDRNGNDTQANQDKREGNQADQQKKPNQQRLNDSADGRGNQQQDRTAKNNEHEQRNTAHQQAPANGLSNPQQPTKNNQSRPLDPSMQAILQQASAMEKEGQRVYLQALAGQKKNGGTDVHTW